MRTYLIISIVIFTLFLPFIALPQSAKFTEIVRKPKPEIVSGKNSKIVFPIIHTGNDSIDGIINKGILAGAFRVPEVFDPSKPEEIIDRAVQDGLAEMSYHIQLNKNGMLSFYIFENICISNCEPAYRFFNYDLKTGKYISVLDLVKKDSLLVFFNKLRKDKSDSLEAYKVRLKKEVDSGKSPMAPELFTWAMKEYVEPCKEVYMQGDYCITEKGIKVRDECRYPPALADYQPDPWFFYTYESLKEWMKPEVVERIRGKKEGRGSSSRQ